MSTHECFAANTLNYPKLRPSRHELQDLLAVWLAADMCSALMARLLVAQC
jgi:hypothetical protein